MKAKEVRYLKGLVSKYESNKMGIITTWWFGLIAWFAMALVFYFVFYWYGRTGSSMLLGFVSTALGVLFGISFMISASETAWGYMRKYIDIESVRDQIRQSDE